MQVDAPQLRQMLAALPGGMPPGSPLNRGSIFDALQFVDLTDAARSELAAFFVRDNCPGIGAFTSNGDAAFFLAQVAEHLTKWPRQGIASRRLEHVAFAIAIVAGPPVFTSPPGALASVYLLHQLEFLFRAMSAGTLDLEGRFVSSQAKAQAEQQLGLQVGTRISDIAIAYRIAKLTTGMLAATLLNDLDRVLPHATMAGGTTLSSIGERIAYFRHRVSHGPLADPSSEAYFYALLVALILYGTPFFQRP
jgi:hypothetical protein